MTFQQFLKHCNLRVLGATACLLGMLNVQPSYAFEPQRTPTPALQEAIGVLALQSPLLFYDAPHYDARIVDELSWEFSTAGSNETLVRSNARLAPMLANEFFISYAPHQKLAFLPVVNELESGWVQVKVSHLMSQSVWVSPRQSQQVGYGAQPSFMTWQQFISYFAKQYGFHWLEGTAQNLKSVHTQPDEAAPLTKVTFVQTMRPLHVRGNWMLVEMRDVAEERPIGWMRWRTEEGDLLLWPNFHQRQALYQAPSNPLNPQAIFERF